MSTYRGDEPLYIGSTVYTTLTYREQYLYHFLTLIIGRSRIGKLKQITRNFLCIETEGVQTDFIMRWTFVILTNLADVDYATNLGIIGEIVQILNQDSTRCELCNFYYCCCNLVFILYCYLAFNSYLIL